MAFKQWPKREGLEPEEVINLYQQGFAGATPSTPDTRAAFAAAVKSTGGVMNLADAAAANGWAGSHAGKLVIPFVHVLKAYPGCWPGPAQQRGDCVSHGGKNARLLTVLCEAVAGAPDEVTGKIEGLPEIPPEGIKNGAFSTEASYWFRGHGGDGWQCESDAAVAIKYAGAVVRKAYPEAGIDLTKYSGSLAGKYGRTKPPANIAGALDDNLIRTAARVSGFDAIRDALGNGYGINSCGGEGFASTRDANGYSVRRGSWSHAMGIIGADDRPEIHDLYGGPGLLLLNSWGRFNSGPRTILGTDIEIPEGSFWARWKDVVRRSYIAFSGVNGWPSQSLADYLGGIR